MQHTYAKNCIVPFDVIIKENANSIPVIAERTDAGLNLALLIANTNTVTVKTDITYKKLPNGFVNTGKDLQNK